MIVAKLETKSGMKISIEGSSKEVSDLIENIENREKRIDERMEFMKMMRERRKKRFSKRNILVHGGEIKLTDILEELIKKRFFDEPKKIREIMIKLQCEEIHAPSSTIHPLLSRLVAKGELLRKKGNEGVWEYKKK